MKKLVPIIWVISVCAAFAVGYTFESQNTAPQQSSSQSLAAKNSELAEITASSVPNTTPAENNNTVQTPALQNKSSSQIATDIYQLFQTEEDSLRSQLKAIELLLSLDEQGLQEVFFHFKQDKNDRAYLNSIAMLITAYAELSPTSALDFILENITVQPLQTQSVYQVLKLWAKSEPQAVLNWHHQQSEINEQAFDKALNIALSELARENIYLVIDEIANIAEKAETAQITSLLTDISYSVSQNTDFISLMEHGRLYDNKDIDWPILSNWLKHSEQGVQDWFANLDESELKQNMRDTIYNVWQPRELAKAADWLVSTSNPTSLNGDVEKIISHWAHQNPSGALDWINLQTQIDTDFATQKLLSSAAFSNPEFAINNIELVLKEKNKVDVLWMVYTAYEKQSAAKAEDFLMSSPYREALQKQIARMKKYKRR